MPLLDITNPAIIKFLVENYEKESRLRINWITKHEEKIKKAATITGEPKNYDETDVIAHKMIGGMATITRDHKVAGYNRRKIPLRDGTFIPTTKHLRHGHALADIGLGDPAQDPRLARPNNSLETDPIMRPVEPKINRIIYKPKPEYGRLKYLDSRSKVSPENKYYFPECVNWDYGWRMKDSELRQVPEYGRCWHLTRTLRNRVGPQPDPSYYKSSDPPGPMKCTAI